VKFIYFLFLIIIFTSCRKEATYWYSDWQIPIINDTLDLKNLTNDSTLAVYNGYYQIEFKRKIATISPVELINVPDTTIEQKFAISIPSIALAPGSSFVNDNKDHVFDLKEAKLKKARIKSGKINLFVISPLATKTFFEIELPSVTIDNLNLKKEMSVEAGTQSNPSSQNASFDLSGYWIELTGTEGNSFNSLPSRIKVYTDPDGAQIQLTNLDSTTFRIEMKDLKFDYAQGYFGTYNVSDTFNFESEILKNNVVGEIDLPSLELKFDIENSIKVPAKATIFEVKNYNSETNYSTNLSHFQIGNPFIIESPTGSWSNLIPSQKSIVFNETTSNIENFIENLGEITTIRYALNVNPWGNISGGWDEFFPDSKMDVTTSISMPLSIGFNDLILLDTFNLALTQDEEKTNVESGLLTFKIENGFPFEGDLELFFLNEFNELIKSYVTNNKINTALSGSFNSQAIQTKYSEIDFNLPSELLDQIPSIKKIILKVKLNSINPTTMLNEQVNIPENAFIWVKVQSSLKLKNIID
jgi:hypothetical protein